MPREKTSKKTARKAGKALKDADLIRELVRRIQRDCHTILEIH